MAATAANLADSKTETALAEASKLSAESALKAQAALKLLAGATRELFIDRHVNAKDRQDSLTRLISQTIPVYASLQNTYTMDVMEWLRELIYHPIPTVAVLSSELAHVYQMNTTAEQEIVVPIMREIETQCAAGFALIHTQSIMQAAGLPAVLINLVKKYCGEDAIVKTGMDLAPHVKVMLERPPFSLTCTFLYNLCRSTQLIPYPVERICKFIEDTPSFTCESDMKRLDDRLMEEGSGASAVCKVNFEAKVDSDVLQQSIQTHYHYNHRWRQRVMDGDTTFYRVNDIIVLDLYSSNALPNQTLLTLCHRDRDPTTNNQVLVPDSECYLYLADGPRGQCLRTGLRSTAPGLVPTTIAGHLRGVDSAAAPAAITPAFTAAVAAASSTSTVSSSAAAGATTTTTTSTSTRPSNT